MHVVCSPTLRRISYWRAVDVCFSIVLVVGLASVSVNGVVIARVSVWFCRKYKENILYTQALLQVFLKKNIFLLIADCRRLYQSYRNWISCLHEKNHVLYVPLRGTIGVCSLAPDCGRYSPLEVMQNSASLRLQVLWISFTQHASRLTQHVYSPQNLDEHKRNLVSAAPALDVGVLFASKALALL